MGTYPEFPESEYRKRYDSLVAKGRADGIEAFIFTDELNIRYFAGGPLTDIWVCRNDFVVLVVPTDASKEPTLLLNKARQGAAKPSWIRDRRFWMASIDAPESNEALKMILQVFKEDNLGSGKIAMETGMYETLFMPIDIFMEMKRKFPHAEIVSAHDHVMATQEIKSKLEIDALREACSISTLAIENGLESLKEGITEREICGIIKAEMYRLGAGGIPFLAVIAGWDGRSICCDSHPTSYGIQKGDVVQVDGGCSVKGYCADMCRTGALGFVKKDRYGELYEISKGAHFSVRSRLKNGAPIRDVCLAGKTYIREKGYGSLLVFGEGQTGHGIGLDLHQPPYLLDDSTGTLKSGMVVAIEPAISENPDWDESSYFTIVENNYAITDDGYEQLTNSDEGIRIV